MLLLILFERPQVVFLLRSLQALGTMSWQICIKWDEVTPLMSHCCCDICIISGAEFIYFFLTCKKELRARRYQMSRKGILESQVQKYLHILTIWNSVAGVLTLEAEAGTTYLQLKLWLILSLWAMWVTLWSHNFYFCSCRREKEFCRLLSWLKNWPAPQSKTY